MTTMSAPTDGDLSREPVRFLVFSASLRAESLNSRIARLAARYIEANGGIVDHARMVDFDAPSFDQDDQNASGFPRGAEEFHRRLEANDAFVIIAPEYNVLKVIGKKICVLVRNSTKSRIG